MLLARKQTINFQEFMSKGKRAEDFLVQKLAEEVKVNPQKAIRLKKRLSVTLTVFTSFLALTNPVFAKGSVPAEIDAALIKIQLICLGLASAVAILCLMLAGMFKMLGLKSKADSWTWDIIKGLVQVLVAPVAVGIIVTVARVILKPLPNYIPF
jgi:hypothetical protein